MNVNEMKGKTVVELNDELKSLLQEKFNIRLQQGMCLMTYVIVLRRVRRDIARIKTVMTEKSTEGNAA
jgi:large subunit ribosomal protein L29